MSRSLRTGAAALAVAAIFATATTPARAFPAPAAAPFPTAGVLIAGYLLGYGFCTALAFGKQTAAGVTGPAARLEAAKDCIIPPLGIAKYAKMH